MGLGMPETGVQVATTAYKWLRAVPPTTYTGPHMDRAYVGEGRRLTAWIPLGPVRWEGAAEWNFFSASPEYHAGVLACWGAADLLCLYLIEVRRGGTWFPLLDPRLAHQSRSRRAVQGPVTARNENGKLLVSWSWVIWFSV